MGRILTVSFSKILDSLREFDEYMMLVVVLLIFIRAGNACMPDQREMDSFERYVLWDLPQAFSTFFKTDLTCIELLQLINPLLIHYSIINIFRDKYSINSQQNDLYQYSLFMGDYIFCINLMTSKYSLYIIFQYII